MRESELFLAHALAPALTGILVVEAQDPVTSEVSQPVQVTENDY